MSKLQTIIKTLRTDFTNFELDELSVSKDPFKQFEAWMKQAIESNLEEPNAVTLATSGKNGQPDARLVLLRGFDKKGFTFYTNYQSRKGQEMRENKKVCLNFYWPELQRQVRVLGTISALPARTSESYFHSRPRESQIGAWASHQSEPLSGRIELEQRFLDLEKKYQGQKIPRPPHWGGYCVAPVSVEFWQGRPSRLHDRILYTKMRTGKWKISRLNP